MEVSITKLWRFNSTAKAKKVVIRGYDFNLGARKLDIFQIPICNAWQSHDFFSFFLSFLSFFLGMRPLRYIAYTLIYFSYSNFQFRNCHYKKSQVSKIILFGFLSNIYFSKVKFLWISIFIIPRKCKQKLNAKWNCFLVD